MQYHTLPGATKRGEQEIFGRLKGLGFGLVFDNDTHRGTGSAVLAIPRDAGVASRLRRNRCCGCSGYNGDKRPGQPMIIGLMGTIGGNHGAGGSLSSAWPSEL